MGPPNMTLPSGPMMAGTNPYGPSGPPPSGIAPSSQPPGAAPMYPSSSGGMYHSPVPPKSSNLNTTQLQQLSAQIKAYKLLARNVPPPEALLSIVSGRRPTQAMLAAGKMNRSPMPPGQSSQQGQRPGMGSVPSPGSMSATDSPGGQSTNISLYPPSPGNRSQTNSPKPPSQQSNPQTQLRQIHSNTSGSVPNVTISSSNELPLPVRQALASQSSNQTPPSKDSNTSTENTVKSELGGKVKSQIKQVKLAPSGTPQGLDPVTILKERENRWAIKTNDIS